MFWCLGDNKLTGLLRPVNRLLIKVFFQKWKIKNFNVVLSAYSINTGTEMNCRTSTVVYSLKYWYLNGSLHSGSTIILVNEWQYGAVTPQTSKQSTCNDEIKYMYSYIVIVSLTWRRSETVSQDRGKARQLSGVLSYYLHHSVFYLE